VTTVVEMTPLVVMLAATLTPLSATDGLRMTLLSYSTREA